MKAGRPRTFDREAAIIIAMEQFWRDGYEATTVAKLTEAMGITPPSLYAAFGDKDQLFHAAAACYFASVSAQLEKALSLPTLHESVAEMLHLSAFAHTDEGTPPGCFMATEPRLSGQREILRRRLVDRVNRGIAAGDVPIGSDPEQVASYIMAVHSGMSSRARDGASSVEVMAIAEMGLAALPSDSPIGTRVSGTAAVMSSAKMPS
jgi:AcrR family transcriptional regulator